MTTPAEWETWLADDWRHYCTTHGIPLTDPFLRRLRITRWSQLAAASYDKRARVYAHGEPPPLKAGAPGAVGAAPGRGRHLQGGADMAGPYPDAAAPDHGAA